MAFDPVQEPTLGIVGQTGLSPEAIAAGNIAFADVRFIRGAFKVYASQSLIEAQDPAQFNDGQIVYAEHEKALFRMDITPGFTTFNPFTVHPATKSSASFNWPNSIISASVVGSTMTFTKGDNSTFDVTLPSGGSGSADTGSLITTASVAGNTMTFTKGDGDTFSVALPGGDSFPYTGSALITGSLGVTGSINATSVTSSFKGNLDGTASTASYVETAQTASFVTLAQTASYVETAQTASYVLNANNANDLVVQVKNNQTSTILKGQVLHSIGVTGENIDVITASNDSAISMPGFAVANQDINSNASGQAIISGKIKNIDTSGLTAGSNVYVNSNGDYTGTKPTGSSLIQNIGVVGKVNATEGELIILGAGRSNDVPNISPGYIWIGNSDSVATPTATSSIQNVVSSSYASTASYVETAQTASYVLNAISSSYALTASYAVSASHEIIKEVSSSYADVAEVARGLENTPSIAVTNITASGAISSSGALFISASESSTVDKVALYDNTTGQLFYTASSAIGGGGSGSSINATGSLADASPGGVVNTITITDFDADVVVRYDAGNLNFIFGIPTAPTPSINISGFITNKFNLELQTYTVTGNFGIGQYSLITGSLLSGSDVLELATGSEISLSRTFTGITGEIAEKTYSLQLTSSNPATNEIDKQLEQQTLSLNKLNAGSPTNTFVTTEVELGAASNKIEVGATGSIQFTGSKSSSDNNWTFVSMSATPGLDPFFTSANTSINANYNVRTSGIGDNITFTSTANYDSATLNNPVVYNNRSDSDTFSRIRSLRFGAFLESDTASIENSLSTGDLGAFQAGGTIYKGTINPNNQTVSISHTTGKVEYIITDDASSYTLSAIEVSGNNFIGTFQHSVAGGSPQIINGYRVYKSSTPLGAANPISYLLKT